jgi:hypothetical protein
MAKSSPNAFEIHIAFGDTVFDREKLKKYCKGADLNLGYRSDDRRVMMRGRITRRDTIRIYDIIGVV